MTPPIGFLEFGVLVHQQAARASFQALHQIAERQIGGRQQQVNMVCCNMPTQDEDVQCGTRLVD